MDSALITPTLDDVLAAHERIRPYIHETPVLTSRIIDETAGAQLFFKCENLQKAGAFKARGASNAVFSLTDAQAARGVATHSSGNHGTCLSYAAGRRGIPCTVVMPRTAPWRRRTPCAATAAGSWSASRPPHRARPCSPKSSPRPVRSSCIPTTIPASSPGRATCARELIAQVPDLDAVIAPIGGGGMVSGTCLTLAGLAPHIAVYAAEPEQADDAHRSLKAGRIIADDAPVTVADGLKVPLKDLTWHFVRHHVADILTVSEAEIVAAMQLIWKRLKIVMEPSSAVALAAVLKNRPLFANKRVGVIITGGNVDLDALPWQ
ncbi:pyridoxal-phosphate dependent enzyme [Methylobacterium oryzae CBMB20]